MEDALISPESFAILSGAGLIASTEKAPIYVHTTSQVQAIDDNTIELPNIACWNGYARDGEYEDYRHASADIFVMMMKDGEISSEPCIPVKVVPNFADGTTILTCYSHAGRIEKDDVVFVDYYVKRTSGSTTIEITPDKFGGNYYLEASTLFRRESDGVDMPAEFVIPNCRVQSNFTFTMAASGDPSTFSFTLDAFPDYTKFDPTHKVLASIQVIEDEFDDDEDSRQPCVDTGLITNYNDKSGVEITYDNDSTEDNIKISVYGRDIESDGAYDSATFGAIKANVVEIDIPHTIAEGEYYKIVQTNPALEYIKTSPIGKTEKLANGNWQRTAVYGYNGDNVGDTNKYQILLTDKRNTVEVKFYKVAKANDITQAGTLVKTVRIKPDIKFALSLDDDD